MSSKGPGRTSGYDAGALIALAMASAGGPADGATLAEHVRKVTGKDGEPIFSGVEEFRKAIGLLNEGKKIRYIGATGPVDFDPFGDVAVPFVGTQLRDGGFVDVLDISLEEVQAVKAKVGS